MAKIAIKRIYADPAATDGCRVLVDRLWPRGLSKVEAEIDYWFKDLAPSNELRHWFDHDPDKWDEFKLRYYVELRKNKTVMISLHKILEKEKKVTLLFGAKDEHHNNAVALAEYLRGL